MRKTLAAAPVLAAMLFWSPVQLPAAEQGKARVSADQRVMRKVKRNSAAKAAASATNVIAEVLGKSFSIQAGGSMTFDATSDFTGAERASIAVKAVNGSDIAIDGFQIWVYWAMPDVDFWTANDVIVGSSFNFYIQGGGVVPVYGPELRLVIQNATNQPMNFDQLTVYAVRNIPAPAATTPPAETPAEATPEQ